MKKQLEKQAIVYRLGSKFVFAANGCWLWNASRDGNGYGILRIDGKTRKAHRIMYELIVGPIPDGLEIDHLCRVKRCVNPSHLEAVTRSENAKRSLHNIRKRQQTHCKRGHLLADARITAKGSRACRACNRLPRRAEREAALSRDLEASCSKL